jgi:hypothetical protein
MCHVDMVQSLLNFKPVAFASDSNSFRYVSAKSLLITIQKQAHKKGKKKKLNKSDKNRFARSNILHRKQNETQLSLKLVAFFR